MRVLCAVNKPWTGIENINLIKFMQKLIAKKHELTFLCQRPLKKDFEWIGQRITLRTYNPIIYLNAELFALLIKNKIKHFSNINQGLGLNCLNCLPFTKIKKPFITWFNSLIANELRSKNKSIISRINQLTISLLNKIEQKIINKAERIFVQDNNTAEIINNQLSVNAEVLHYPVNLQKYKPSNKKKDNYLLTVMPLNKQSRVIDLIEAFSKIRMKFNNLKLIIIGSGIEQISLKNRAEKLHLTNSIKFINQVSEKALIDYYRNALLYTNTGVNDFYCLRISQAMACACPVISTESNSINDYIKQDYNGYIIPSNNPDALSNAIINFIEDNKLRNKFSKNCLKIIKEFDETLIAKKLLKAYNEIK